MILHRSAKASSRLRPSAAVDFINLDLVRFPKKIVYVHVRISKYFSRGFQNTKNYFFWCVYAFRRDWSITPHATKKNTRRAQCCGGGETALCSLLRAEQAAAPGREKLPRNVGEVERGQRQKNRRPRLPPRRLEQRLERDGARARAPLALPPPTYAEVPRPGRGPHSS